ncbi:uncharacterized protein LOC143028543 [Oratosquilla oratoria]|uniref:uncharacterized protein LOC143028543 n=1 Tax=Oratosquilla oratoria TaxID=337810 RepID=UPI003F776297
MGGRPGEDGHARLHLGHAQAPPPHRRRWHRLSRTRRSREPPAALRRRRRRRLRRASKRRGAGHLAAGSGRGTFGRQRGRRTGRNAERVPGRAVPPVSEQLVLGARAAAGHRPPDEGLEWVPGHHDRRGAGQGTLHPGGVPRGGRGRGGVPQVR